MIQPNFIILGAAKAGTTALYHYLLQHPEIGMSLVKETNYLALKDSPLDFSGPGDNVTINRFSVTTEQDWHDQFTHCGGKQAVGEASPLYLYSPAAPREILTHVPHAKLIAILRNPVDRAFSAFLHLVRDHRETTDSFLEGLRREPERIAANWEHIWHYVAMGRYADQLERYYDLFPHDQIRVYIYRDFRLNPAALIRDVLNFLEVDPDVPLDQSVRHNVSVHPEKRPPLESDARQFIVDALAADVARLESLIDRDLSHWLIRT